MYDTIKQEAHNIEALRDDTKNGCDETKMTPKCKDKDDHQK